MEQPLLDNFLSAEAEARESVIDHDARFRHKKAVALRWFKYYRACKDEKKKVELLRQYNRIARMGKCR